VQWESSSLINLNKFRFIMALRWLFAALHFLALGIGLGAVWARGRALAHLSDSSGLRRVFVADNWWGVAALLWLATGIVRLFWLEKGTSYYFNNWVFWLKMGLFLIVFLLELLPMITFIRWRISVGKDGTPDLRRATLFARISTVQALLIVAMVVAASGMARGYGTF
jgi:putative membrane protein